MTELTISGPTVDRHDQRSGTRLVGSDGQGGPRRSERRPWFLIVAVAIAAVPFAAALIGFVGDEWFVIGDWASIDLRTRAVGSTQTPLIGPYSTRGWAHPGPALYWLAAPLHRLSGGDPRSMLMTATLVNLASIAGVGWVARRVGGRGMALAAILAATLLAHGLGPGRIVDIWNPLFPLFPLLLVCFLAWSVALGHRRNAITAIVIGALVAQTHIGMLPILAVIAAWTAIWVVATRRRPVEPIGGPPRRSPSWLAVIGLGAGGALLTWLAPLIDQLFRTGNLNRLGGYFLGGSAEPVGLARGAGLVARYVRPDGPWIGGPEPLLFGSVVGSAPLIVAAMVAALGLLTVALWRTGSRDVAAGTSLAATLVLGGVPIAANVDEPVFDYLVKWLSVVGALSWFWLVWGTWSLLRHRITFPIRRALPAVAVVAIGAAALWSVPAALQLRFPAAGETDAVESLRRSLGDELPRDRPIRIEHRGDDFGNVASGLIYGLRRDGFDVVTTDGSLGLKYGPDAVWRPGDPPDDVYTVAVDYPFSFTSSRAECIDAGAEPVASYDELSPGERRRLGELDEARFFASDDVTSAERREAQRLRGRSLAVTMFVAGKVCASGP